MSKSLAETARAILEGNADTLKPKSGPSMPPESLGSATKLGDAPEKPGEGSNLGAAASAPIKKDSSKPTKGAKAADPTQHLEEDEDEEGDVVAEGSPAARPVKKDMADAIAKFKGKVTKVDAKKDKKGKPKMAAEEAEELEEEEEVEISEELADFIDQLAEEGYSEDEIAQAIEENFEVVEEEDEGSEELEEETEEEEQYQVDMTEHVNALLEGESLSEEFREKATMIFEAAVNAKLQEEVAKIQEAFAETLEEEIENIMEELSSNVDDYLNYVVEQWMAENEVAIEAGLRTELTEDFITGMRNLFAEHYIDIPDDKVDVVESLGSKVEELEEKLNEEIERNVELTKTLNESMKAETFYQVVDGLTTTQAEKLRELAENVEFNSAEDFAQKMMTLRESYFPTTVKSQGALDTIEPGTEGQTMIAEDLKGPMAAYVRTLGKSLPK
jgi:hypothetical protein